MLTPPFSARPPLGPPRASARQRALADLRGIDLAPLEKVRERPARELGTVLPRVLKELRFDTRQSEAEIVRVWNHMIDPVIAAHAQPAGLHNGTLFITVDSNVWHAEIVRYRRREILARMQHSFGRELIKKISFRLG